MWPALEPGEAAGLATVRQALAAAGTPVRSGDILVLRLGRWARQAALGLAPTLDSAPGLSIECAEWVHAQQVAAIITDVGLDPAPSPVAGVPIPWHVLTLARMGLRLVDGADPEALATTCARLGRWEFLCVLAPLPISGASASPVNPLALF